MRQVNDEVSFYWVFKGYYQCTFSFVTRTFLGFVFFGFKRLGIGLLCGKLEDGSLICKDIPVLLAILPLN